MIARTSGNPYRAARITDVAYRERESPDFSQAIRRGDVLIGMNPTTAR